MRLGLYPGSSTPASLMGSYSSPKVGLSTGETRSSSKVERKSDVKALSSAVAKCWPSHCAQLVNVSAPAHTKILLECEAKCEEERGRTHPRDAAAEAVDVPRALAAPARHLAVGGLDAVKEALAVPPGGVVPHVVVEVVDPRCADEPSVGGDDDLRVLLARARRQDERLRHDADREGRRPESKRLGDARAEEG